MSDPTGIISDAAYAAGYADGTRDVQARVDAGVEARLAPIRALLQPYPCHQCEGTGTQTVGEGGVLRSVDAPVPATETCHLCGGQGLIAPIGVQSDDLRAALRDATHTDAPEVTAEGAEDEEGGCDCTELCSMGPTCPGGMLARLPGSGCWRTQDGTP